MTYELVPFVWRDLRLILLIWTCSSHSFVPTIYRTYSTFAGVILVAYAKVNYTKEPRRPEAVISRRRNCEFTVTKM